METAFPSSANTRIVHFKYETTKKAWIVFIPSISPSPPGATNLLWQFYLSADIVIMCELNSRATFTSRTGLFSASDILLRARWDMRLGRVAPGKPSRSRLLYCDTHLLQTIFPVPLRGGSGEKKHFIFQSSVACFSIGQFIGKLFSLPGKVLHRGRRSSVI